MAPLFFLFGIFPARAPVATGAIRLRDFAPSVVEEGALAALVSELTGDEYEPDQIAAASGNMTWMGSRARAHDAVLTAYSDAGPVIPLAMFTATFASTDGVRAMLKERASELAPVLERVARG